jgi:hypothetical protein
MVEKHIGLEIDHCRNLDMGIFIKGWQLGFHFLGFSTHLEHYGSGWLVTG